MRKSGRKKPTREALLNIIGKVSLFLLHLCVKSGGGNVLFIAREYGMLGNRLFIYAHMIACGIENGFRVINTAFAEYRHFFKGSRKGLVPTYPAGTLPVRLEGFPGRLAHRFIQRASALAGNGDYGGFFGALELDNNRRECFRFDGEGARRLLIEKRAVFLRGWRFSDTTALMKHAGAVREYFRPAERFLPGIEAPVRRARESKDVLVGVMVRHGDYRRWRGGRYFYGLEVYLRIMRDAKALFPGKKVGFLVTSNEEQPPESFREFDAVLCPPDTIQNLYSLARCDYLIATLSTYAGWAAFYGNVPLYTIEDPELRISLDAFRGSRLEYPA